MGQATSDSAIAVVGMGCRFPGASGVDAYWKLLMDNGDAVTPVPATRFAVDEERSLSRHGGFVDDLFGFDAAFFGISPREAQVMDPQQRILLHVVWEALEAAGIRPSSLAGSSAGIFVGQATAEYADALGHAATADVRTMAGARLRAVTAGRVSYALDLRGPSLVLDTACSSSLVAVHTARRSLLTGECDLAIAAAVNAVLSPLDAIAYSQGEMLAPDGRCKFGDSSADGFVRSEGVGAVVLKRLTDALADGDPVLALLAGSAVTNDGKGSGLLLQPAVTGQAAMLQAAWRDAGVRPGQVDYVEAHRTGTTVGDGVELRALAQMLTSDGPLGRRLPVGSVKTNIGHAEAAAGMAGLIKAVLMARHRTIPASLHLRSKHPLLAEESAPIEVVRANTPLTPVGEQAVLGVSSFGLSGTNAHVVVREYTPEPPAAEPAATDSGESHLLTLTARSLTSLQRLATRYAEYLEPGGAGHSLALPDICATAATRRDAHPYRLWAVGVTHDELARVLRALAADEQCPDGGIHEAGFGEARDVTFVFPGQGSQWRGMGRELFAHSASFRAAMKECDAAVREELGWSVVEFLHDGGEEGAEAADAVDVVQPALWAMEVSLAALWRARGVEPALCVGHSMGEVAAACVAGALSVRDAAAVICRRSTLMQTVAGRGAMLAADVTADAARDLAAAHGDLVCVAAENAPESTVLAGDETALRLIAEQLDARGVFCRSVKVNVASHSPVMDELRDDLLDLLADLRPTVPRTALFSTVRCAPVVEAELDARYWMDNLRERVRFAESVTELAKRHDSVFLEISPHPVLVPAVQDGQESIGTPSTAVPTLLRGLDERRAVARALGQVFALGGKVDWNRWFDGAPRQVPLPLYAWDTEDFRDQPAAQPDRPTHYVREVGLPRLGAQALGAGVALRGLTPVPPVLYFDAVAEAVRDLAGDGPVTLENLRFGDAPLALADVLQASLRIVIEPSAAPGSYRFTVEALSVTGASRPLLCIEGEARHGHPQPAGIGADEVDLALTRCTEYVPAPEFYRRAQGRGYRVAHELRSVRQLWRRDGESVALVRTSGTSTAAALEAGLLPMIASWPHSAVPDGAESAYVTVAFGSVYLAGELGDEHWSVAEFTPPLSAPGRRDEEPRAHCSVTLIAPNGSVLAAFQALSLRTLPPQMPLAGSTPTPSPAPAAEPGPAGVGHPTADAIVALAAGVLGISASRLDVRRPLRDMGLDSLMATQLRRRLQGDFGLTVPVGRLLGAQSLAGLAAALAEGS
ncbi:type I polyketide synthase [Streptomyces sp. ISL-94]|uniref:type I polyketide synthase n=1 Tax=Streptomyces sp. ISL-94 TaxID=2819190 RepID=UPI001BE51A68|nr:type I polyketide synthase [Streptomyces sp. ISL-94]MBT2481746.1 acyltransferase domain-containing protein [Streptomyces sp. ISL-94]